MSKRVVGVLLLLLSLGACRESTGPEPVAGELSTYRDLWRAQEIDDYQFTYARSCFCTPEDQEPVRITVRDDRVVSVVSLKTGEKRGTLSYPTVERLFDRLAEAMQSGTYAEAKYHPRLGYPVQAVVGTLANDAGVAHSLRELRPTR